MSILDSFLTALSRQCRSLAEHPDVLKEQKPVADQLLKQAHAYAVAAFAFQGQVRTHHNIQVIDSTLLQNIEHAGQARQAFDYARSIMRTITEVGPVDRMPQPLYEEVHRLIANLEGIVFDHPILHVSWRRPSKGEIAHLDEMIERLQGMIKTIGSNKNLLQRMGPAANSLRLATIAAFEKAQGLPKRDPSAPPARRMFVIDPMHNAALFEETQSTWIGIKNILMAANPHLQELSSLNVVFLDSLRMLVFVDLQETARVA